MVEVIKSFYKLSESKTYNVNDKVSFDAKTETRLAKEGLVKKVEKKSKSKK